MPNGTYGGVRGRKTKVGKKTTSFSSYSIIDDIFLPDSKIKKANNNIYDLSVLIQQRDFYRTAVNFLSRGLVKQENQ